MSPITIVAIVLAGVVVGCLMLIFALRALGFAIMPDSPNRSELDHNLQQQSTPDDSAPERPLPKGRAVALLPGEYRQFAQLLATLPRLIETAEQLGLDVDRESPVYLTFASEVEIFVCSFLASLRRVADPSVLECGRRISELLYLSEAWGKGGIPSRRTDLKDAIRYGEALKVLMIRPLKRFEDAIARTERDPQAQRILGVLPILECASVSAVEMIRRISQHEFKPSATEGIANGVDILQTGFIASRRHALAEAARQDGEHQEWIH